MSVPDGRRRLEEEILAIDQELRELGHREGRNCPFCKRLVPEGSLAACARGGGVFGRGDNCPLRVRCACPNSTKRANALGRRLRALVSGGTSIEIIEHRRAAAAIDDDDDEVRPPPLHDEPRSILGDDHARRCLRLRTELPRLERPDCRAANATLGVHLNRLSVPRELYRDILFLAFNVPDAAARRKAALQDEAFGRGPPISTPADPPMLLGAYRDAVAAALAGPTGLTSIAAGSDIRLLAGADEAYELHCIVPYFGAGSLRFCSLFPFEANFPALVGCDTVTIRSTVQRHTKICVGGPGVRNIEEGGWLASSGTFSLPPVEHAFSAPRSGGWRGQLLGAEPPDVKYFSISELTRAMASLPESWRQIGRRHGLVAYDCDNDGALSYGRFTMSDPRHNEMLQFGAVGLRADFSRAKCSFLGDGRGLVEVEWHVTCNTFMTLETSPRTQGQGGDCSFYDTPSTPAGDVLNMWEYAHDEHGSTRLSELRTTCIDKERWTSTL
mmetsp:Transcript_2053/g.6208  ORF Transcript_2053/g.6208 Transcript_2053/m.6208 type:complete len:499 (+) Transcript_2053:293-1789(+)